MAVLLVTSLLDDMTEGTLRERISIAETNDTIIFGTSGTIFLNEDLGELLIPLSLTINGDIDGNNTPDITLDAQNNSRVFQVNDSTDESSDVYLNGLTITGGSEFRGGGISNEENLTINNSVLRNNIAGQNGGGIYTTSNLTISNSVLTENDAQSEGGAIWIDIVRGDEQVSIANSQITNNSAVSSGGGIGSFDSEVNIADSVISGNSAMTGGGFYAEYGYITVNRSTFSNNVGDRGGGIGIYFYAELTLIDSEVSGNTANRFGGGIFSTADTKVSVISSTVSRNSSSDSGGGIYNQDKGELLIENSSISNNKSRYAGGGIYNVDADTVVNNSSISKNIISVGLGFADGGGIFSRDGDLTINSSSITDNVSNSGRSASGGGISAERVTVNDSTISGNTSNGSESSGAGIYGGTVTVFNSTIINNDSYGYFSSGGGIDARVLTVNNSTISGNSSEGYFSSGGGVNAEVVTVDNSTISNNISEGVYSDGGGISGSSVVVSNSSTISDNISSGISYSDGGGISGSTVTVSTSTVNNNRAITTGDDSEASGGGIYSFSGDVLVNNSNIMDNAVVGGTVASGGGIFNSKGDVAVTNSTVSGNTTYANYASRSLIGSGGGGIFSQDGVLVVSNSIIRDNVSEGYYDIGVSGSGGGIYGRNSTIAVTDSRISNNVADGRTGHGGGISANNSGSLTVSNSTISDNVVFGRYSWGGGVDSSTDSLVISNSTISGNEALGGGYGGGIHTSSSSAIVSNSTISGNQTSYVGSGIHTWSERLQIRNSTITNNSGIRRAEASGVTTRGNAGTIIEVVSSIIAGNADSDVELRNNGINTFVSQGNNLIGIGNAIGAFNQSTDIVGVTDPRLAPLADNGGVTQTHALLPDSPAIDAGRNPDGLDTDQRGILREINGQTDIGAFEVNSFFFSLGKGTNLKGTNVANEDIVYFDGTQFNKFFDGSDLNLNSVFIDAFDVVSDTVILLSFNNPITLDGVGRVDDSDIVQFTATSLGETTTGEFELYFDGSDVGLTQNGEGIDALTRMSDGTLIISTSGSYNVPGASGRDEDLLQFTPANTNSMGENTSGSWSLYLDGSRVSLTEKGENIDGVAVTESGHILLNTSGNFNVPGISGANADIFAFNRSSSVSGSYASGLFFDANPFGLIGDEIVAFDTGSLSV